MLRPFLQKNCIEAGCDEAGRGCYAGPVFAAAVILPVNFYHPELNDSKQLNATQREKLRVFIEENALHYAVAMVNNEEIDSINILKASFKAMHLALEQLPVKPGMILVDGNRFITWKNVPHQCIIKGDGIYASIAAASILAKTYRDKFMCSLHKQFPQYNWAKNKGYGTAEHRKAIEENGLCKYHRKSFNILPTQLKIGFSMNEEIV
ncbi:MAG: ribonuclease HII [Bacteroidetes bacterium]|nr:ribonuclease HII [Bacteroidota bacterium]